MSRTVRTWLYAALLLAPLAVSLGYLALFSGAPAASPVAAEPGR